MPELLKIKHHPHGNITIKSSWVKRLGQWHLSGENGRTKCGTPMLGNNYADYISREDRSFCPQCFSDVEILN